MLEQTPRMLWLYLGVASREQLLLILANNVLEPRPPSPPKLWPVISKSFKNYRLTTQSTYSIDIQKLNLTVLRHSQSCNRHCALCCRPESPRGIGFPHDKWSDPHNVRSYANDKLQNFNTGSSARLQAILVDTYRTFGYAKQQDSHTQDQYASSSGPPLSCPR